MTEIKVFELFGSQHIWVIAIIFTLFAWILFYGKKINPFARKIISWVIIVTLLGNEVLYYVLDFINGTFDFKTNLSLHLCGFSVFLVSYTIFTKNQKTFSLCYFWSIGALQAIFTPNITEIFPSFRFVQFFASHGFIVLGVLFLTVTEGFRPTWRSLFTSIFITLILFSLIGLFNYTFDANYMFMCNKPIGTNITNLLSDEFYLASLILIGIFFMILFYMPYAVWDLLNKKKS